MDIKTLDLLFDTDTLKEEEIEEIVLLGSQLLEILKEKINSMGLDVVDSNCITRM